MESPILVLNVLLPMLLEPVCLGLGVRNQSCVTLGSPNTSLGFSLLILSLDGQGKSDNRRHDHEELESTKWVWQ